jgi:hypothetical protein
MKKLAQILTIVFVTVSMYSCYDFPIMVTGTGPVISQEFDLPSFDAIASETVIDIEVVQGDSQKVVAEGNENMMNFIELNVINNKLHVDLVNGSYSNFKLKVYITVPTLQEVELESTGDIDIEGFNGLRSLKLKSTSTGKIKTDGTFDIAGDLDLVCSSTGSINVNANCKNIEARMSSTGSINIEGNCVTQDVTISGTGSYNAFDLLSEECIVETNSVGDARVNVSEELDVTISSIGNVYYKGNPRVSIHDSSIGDLIHSN